MKLDRKATDLIRDSRAFIALPIDQGNGYFDPSTPDAPCCVGARLAQYMSVSSFFYDGIDAFAQALGCTRAHLILMLRACGAGQHPFSAAAWETAPVDVWDKLAVVEELPLLSKADLSKADLYRADLAGADLRGADLSQADVSEANLSAANLSKANLSQASLYKADVSYANLYKAKLSYADVSEANLCYANLYKADLSKADLYRADVSGAVLYKADVSEAVLPDADMSQADVSAAVLPGDDSVSS